MKRNKLFTVALILILAVALVSGCGGGSDTTGGDVKEVVIGYTGPLSGAAASYGMDTLNGLDMAINEINEADGITIDGQKYKFRLEKLDDKADPTQTINNARRLKDQYEVPAIFNPVYTSMVPMMEINQEPGNEFLIVGFTSTPEASEMGNELTIINCVPFSQYVTAFTELAWAEGWRTGAMVVTLGAYGDEWREQFKEKWESLGGEILADQPANYYGQTDFSSQLSAAIATKPDFLLIGGPSGPTGLVIEQARGLGFKGGLVAIDQAKSDYMINTNFNGSSELLGNFIGTIAVKDSPARNLPAFIEKYTETYKIPCTWEANFNYVGMRLLAMAMEEAGTVSDVRAIRAAFDQVTPNMDLPAEVFGVTDGGRLELVSSTQMFRDGEPQEPVQIMWWPETEAEFNEHNEILNSPLEVRWIKEY